MRTMLAAIALVFGVVLTQASIAQESKPLSPAEQAQDQGIIMTARNLASYADARGDALALVVAARMLTQVPGRVLGEGEKGAGGASIDINGMLDRAAKLSNGDQDIAGEIKKVRQAAEETSRGMRYWQYYCSYGWCQASLGLLLIADRSISANILDPAACRGVFRFPEPDIVPAPPKC